LAARLPDWTAQFMNPEKLPLLCSPAKIRRRRSVPRLEEERAVLGIMVKPVRLPHCLHQFAKKRRASLWNKILRRPKG